MIPPSICLSANHCQLHLPRRLQISADWHLKSFLFSDMQYATCFIMLILLIAMESRKMALSKVFLLETGSPWTICLRGIKYAATRLMRVCCTFLRSKTYLISSGSNSDEFRTWISRGDATASHYLRPWL